MMTGQTHPVGANLVLALVVDAEGDTRLPLYGARANTRLVLTWLCNVNRGGSFPALWSDAHLIGVGAGAGGVHCLNHVVVGLADRDAAVGVGGRCDAAGDEGISPAACVRTQDVVPGLSARDSSH